MVDRFSRLKKNMIFSRKGGCAIAPFFFVVNKIFLIDSGCGILSAASFE